MHTILSIALAIATTVLPAKGRAIRVMPRQTSHRRIAFVPNSILDICATIDAASTAKVYDPLGLTKAFSDADICLCVSALPLFIRTNAVAHAYSNVHGADTVETALKALINAAGDREECSYPAHARPLCTPRRPCDYDCQDGYKPTYAPDCTDKPSTCSCPPPMVECNGKCVSHQSCSSAAPKKRSELSIWREARASCGTKETHTDGFSVCGIVGRDRRQWECIDTRSHLESCGGCLTPLVTGQPTGRDCTSIPGVQDVSCYDSACRVTSCKSGWNVHTDGQSCVQTSASVRTSSSIVVSRRRDASAYGAADYRRGSAAAFASTHDTGMASTAHSTNATNCTAAGDDAGLHKPVGVVATAATNAAIGINNQLSTGTRILSGSISYEDARIVAATKTSAKASGEVAETTGDHLGGDAGGSTYHHNGSLASVHTEGKATVKAGLHRASSVVGHLFATTGSATVVTADDEHVKSDIAAYAHSGATAAL